MIRYFVSIIHFLAFLLLFYLQNSNQRFRIVISCVRRDYSGTKNSNFHPFPFYMYAIFNIFL